MDAESFSYQRNGRSQATLLAVAAVWVGLIAAIVVVEASPWLMAALGLFTLPALWDLYKNPASGLQFNEDALVWFTGTRDAEIAWREIDKVRFNTRLDFSVRATVVLHSGRKIRLPYESTPPHNLLEAALNARGIRTERHHFSLLG
ncbi:MAG: hypothetical protein AAGF27_05650 [Pseudomonadota bacterium]